MKTSMFGALAVALAVCALAFLGSDAAHAALASSPVLSHGAGTWHGWAGAAVTLAVGLDNLRAQHTDLVARAAAKIAEVVDGMAPEAIRVIETDHAEMVRDIGTVAQAITTGERAQPSPAPAPVLDLKAERARSAEINTLATKHAMPADFASRHIADGTAIEDVRRFVLEEIAKRGAGDREVSPRISITVDAHDTMRGAIETAIIHRANPGAVKIAGDSPARQWRAMTSILEMGRVYIEETTGQRLRHLNKRELAGAVLGLESGRRDGGMSTSDFPNILANVINKRLRNAYEVAPQHWKRLGRESNAPDFKSKAVVQLSNAPNLPVIKEGGEYTYSALADGKESYALATYGRIIRLTRQSLINDDLSAFDRIPMLLGRAAAETEAGVFWSILTANANMADGVALFHATHGNLSGTNDAITIASLSAARASMRKQKGLAKKAADAEPLNVIPAFLVVSPDKETEAQQFVAQIAPTQAGSVNPFTGSLVAMAEARLTGLTWYVFADPATIDTIEYAYLEGENGLYTEQRFGWDVDGIEVKGRLDFAAKAIDWRGMYRNPGA